MYWFENQSLFRSELTSLESFKSDYNHPLFSYDTKIRDSDKKFEVIIRLPYKPADTEPWDLWYFRMLYDHDHPSPKADGIFGGTIKVYPIKRFRGNRWGLEGEIYNLDINFNFEHLVNDGNGGRYVCQARRADGCQLNAYYALSRTVRWLVIYYGWEKTGYRISRD